MDSFVSNIISGIISNALYGMLTLPFQTRAAPLFTKRCTRPDFEKIISRDAILQKAAATLAKSIELPNSASTEKLRLFLVSSDVDAIVRKIYSCKLQKNSQERTADVKEEFTIHLSLSLGKSKVDAEKIATPIFSELVACCERALAVAIDRGILSAHETKSELRHMVIRDELASIKNVLEALRDLNKPNLEAFNEFELTYRKQVGERHRYITPPHFDAARKLPIDDLYVVPVIVRQPYKKEDEPSALEFNDFLSVLYRAVLLGNPGGGKSTMSLKICYDLAKHYSDRLVGGRQLTPILVVLREYGTVKKEKNCSILQFIETKANAQYQVQPPPGAFEFMLISGRVMVIFDGLDELLDTSYRQEITGDVESFCYLYPTLPVLVTSREIGYEEAPLDNKKFEVFRLANFDDEQVSDYVTKWFAADHDLLKDEQTQKAKLFLEESKIVSDLRANPLMLALMCNIYRGEGYIPRNRPDVYEKCALMLFERWDKGRGIHVVLPFDAHIKPAMKYLAHWIYSNASLQGGVTEKKLIKKAAEYLNTYRFEKYDEAESAANNFIGFCRGRAWVFTDVGTTKAGERLYQFTHRTFLEYFTAAYLVRKYSTPKDLYQILAPRIAKGEWDVVSQLAIQIQHNNVEGAGDTLLLSLLEQAKVERSEHATVNILSFSARCLEFLVPQPKVGKEITISCAEKALQMVLIAPKKAERIETGRHEYAVVRLVYPLLASAVENRPTVSASLENYLVERIQAGSEEDAIVASQLAHHFDMVIHMARVERPAPEDLLAYWHNTSIRIIKACYQRVSTLAPKYVSVAQDLFGRLNISASDLIAWHGIGAIFGDVWNPLFPYLRFGAIAERLLHSVMDAPFRPDGGNYFKTHVTQIDDLGRILLTVNTPWLTKKVVHHDFSFYMHRRFHKAPEIEPGHPYAFDNLTPNVKFAVFVFVAVFLELTHQSRRSLEELSMAMSTNSHVINRLEDILKARFAKVDNAIVQIRLRELRLNSDQADFILAWVQKKLSLTNIKARSERNNN